VKKFLARSRGSRKEVITGGGRAGEMAFIHAHLQEAGNGTEVKNTG
jgi:hypothetical protein